MSRWLTGLRVALPSVIRRKRVEEELDEELQYHLERQIDDGLSAGLAPEEARYAALRAMGAIGKSKEECRDLRSATFVSDVLGDLRYAGRALRRTRNDLPPARTEDRYKPILDMAKFLG